MQWTYYCRHTIYVDDQFDLARTDRFLRIVLVALAADLEGEEGLLALQWKKVMAGWFTMASTQVTGDETVLATGRKQPLQITFEQAGEIAKEWTFPTHAVTDCHGRFTITEFSYSG